MPEELLPLKKKRITIQSGKAKGRRLQQWFAKQIAELTGFEYGKDCDIESRPMGQSGIDIRMSKQVLEIFPYSPECFVGSTLVLTENGFRPISKLKIGEKVFTSKGRFRKIINIFSKETNNILKLTTEGCTESILTTPEHPFETFDFYYKPITDCSYIAKLIYSSSNYDKHFDALHLNRQQFTNDFLNENEWYCACGCGQSLPKIGSRKRVKRYIQGHGGAHYNITNIPLTVSLDYELAFLFGIYIAEGNVSQNNLVITIDKRKDLLRDFICQIITNKFNYKPKLYSNNKTNSLQIKIHSVIIANFFKSVLGTGSKNKYLGKFLFLNKKILAGLLRGYFLGDGCCGNDFARCESVSRQLAYEINFALLRFGIHSKVMLSKRSERINDQGKSYSDLYSILLIQGGLSRFKQIMKGEIGALKSLSKIKLSGQSPFIFDFLHNRLYSQIRKKEIKNYKKIVYNLSVEDDETYVIEGGYIVHNCKCQENWAVHQWIEQAKANQLPNTDWVICAKRNHSDPVVIIDAKVFFKILKGT